MSEDVEAESAPRQSPRDLQHSAFPADLPDIEVLARFGVDLCKILPAEEIHVIDPYLLSGGAVPQVHAARIVLLLAPALRLVRRVAFVHGKTRPDVLRLNVRGIMQGIMASKYPTAEVAFREGSQMHGRYIVSDRASALLMDFSFNTLSRSHGTSLLVTAQDELDGIVAEVERFDPSR